MIQGQILKRLEDRKRINRSWKTQLTQFALFFIYAGMWFFALTPCFKLPLFNVIYTCCWIFEITAVIFYAFYYDVLGDGKVFSISELVSSLLFLAQMVAHLVILLDSLAMNKFRTKLYQSYDKLELLLRENLQKPISAQEATWQLALVIILIVMLLTPCHAVIIWTTFQTQSTSTVLYWHTFPSALALQFKILEFLTAIVVLNEHALVVRTNIHTLGEQNLQRIFEPHDDTKKRLKRMKKRKFVAFLVTVSPSLNDNDDDRQMVILKSAYSEIYALFQLLNDCYGWSLLAFSAMYFIDFVCNSYWIFLALIIQGRDNYAFLQNGGFVLIVVVLLSVLCWHCQKSDNHSRYIGGLIYKLVKPLGNKRYNDLVSEFSLQTLHQQFIITAKEFFNLNLNLLGSMVAAIVTYLVILIQFMFTEKSNAEKALTTLAPLNYPVNVTTAIMIVPTTVQSWISTVVAGDMMEKI